MAKIAIIISSRVEGNVNHGLAKLLDSMVRRSEKHSNFEVLVKYDHDDTHALPKMNWINGNRYPFPVRQFWGERGCGYIDIHRGYNQLMNELSSDTEIVGAMADDFVVHEYWDQAILNVVRGSGEYFIIHQRPHPWLRDEDGKMKILRVAPNIYPFDMSQDMFDASNLHVIDEAPLWSRKLLDAVQIRYDPEIFPVSFTDAWTLCLEYVLYQNHGVTLTKFLPDQYVERTLCSVDQIGNERWHTDRKVNFDYIKSSAFRYLVALQAERVAEMVRAGV